MSDGYADGMEGAAGRDLLLEFDYSTTKRPSDCFDTGDNRELAVCYRSISVADSQTGRLVGYFDFSAPQAPGASVIYGLSAHEPHGRWSLGPRTSLFLSLKEPVAGALKIEIAHEALGKCGRATRLRVNGRPLGSIELTGGTASVDVSASDLFSAWKNINNVSLAVVDQVVVSIIIPNFERPDLTYASVVAVLSSRISRSFEIVVVDNGSSKAAYERLRASNLPIRIVRLTKRAAYGAANNVSAEEARGEYIVLLNNDAFVTSGVVDKLVSELADANVGAVGPVLRYPDGAIQEVGGFVAPSGFTLTQNHNGFMWDLPRAMDVDYISGACLAIRRSDYARFGGFDPAFEPAYYEDVDLCLRLRAGGLSTRLVRDALAFHLRGASSDGLEAARETWIYRNRLVFLSRWGKWLASRDAADAPHPFIVERDRAKPADVGGSGSHVDCIIISPSPTHDEWAVALDVAAALGQANTVLIASTARRARSEVCHRANALGLPYSHLSTCTTDDLCGLDLNVVVVIGQALLACAPFFRGTRSVYFPFPGPVATPDGPLDLPQFHSILVASNRSHEALVEALQTVDGSSTSVTVLPPYVALPEEPRVRGDRERLLVSLGPLKPNSEGGAHEATLRAIRQMTAERPDETWRVVIVGDLPEKILDPTFIDSLPANEKWLDVEVITSPPHSLLSRLLSRAGMIVVADQLTNGSSHALQITALAIALGCAPVVTADSAAADLCVAAKAGFVFSNRDELHIALAEAARLVAAGGLSAETCARFLESNQQARKNACVALRGASSLS